MTERIEIIVKASEVNGRLADIRAEVGNVQYLVNKENLEQAHEAAEHLQHLAFDLKHYLRTGDE